MFNFTRDYNPKDRVGAFKKALEWGDTIPIGVIYKNNRPAFEERVPIIQEQALVKQPVSIDSLRNAVIETLNSYY